MSKKLYVFVIFVMSLVLLNTGVIFAASTPKLESKSGSLYIGNSKTVSIVGSNIKSVTCKSKNTKIAKVKAVKTKAIKVSGVAEGKTKIVVTVVNKAKKSVKLIYTVTVKAQEVIKEFDDSVINKDDDFTDTESEELEYIEELYVYDINKVVETFDKAEAIGEKFEKPVTVVFKSEDGGILEIPKKDYSYVIFRFKAPDVDVYNNAHFYLVRIEDFED